MSLVQESSQESRKYHVVFPSPHGGQTAYHGLGREEALEIAARLNKVFEGTSRRAVVDLPLDKHEPHPPDDFPAPFTLPGDERAEAFVLQAVELADAEYPIAAGVMARMAIEWSLFFAAQQHPEIDLYRSPGKGTAGSCRQKLLQAGAIDQEESRHLRSLIELGGKVAHGHPISRLRLSKLLAGARRAVHDLRCLRPFASKGGVPCQ